MRKNFLVCSSRLQLFHWKGFVFSTDWSLFFVFGALILSLRFRLFPFFYSDHSIAFYWGMALVAAVGMAFSVLAHEIVHLSIARRMGSQPQGVFLYIFGSGTPVELKDGNQWKSSKLYLSGVAFSAALALAFVGLAHLSETNALNQFLVGVFFHLGAFNLSLAVFQLLPALPLDGGRLLLNLFSREGKIRSGIVKAIYRLGTFIGLAFVATGSAQLYAGRPVLGIWIFILGFLLLKANQDEYQYFRVKGILQGTPTMVMGMIGALLFSAHALAAFDSPEELRAIEKAHSAVTEIETDFRQALNKAAKSGELKRALPGCRIKNLRGDEMKVGRTSHRLRNPNNAPPEWTKPYLDKFSKAKRSEIPKHVLTKIGNHRYGYAEPIFVEQICLNCHGSSVKADVKEAIRETYPQDKALDFNLGDFRGLLWLEIKDE